MRSAFILLAIAVASDGQFVIDPSKLPRELLTLHNLKNQTLDCTALAIKPRLDFGFRFQSGYVVRIPLSQYEGKGHRWGILTRVTPENRSPVFLLNAIQLPEIPKTRAEAEVGGSYLLGEGRFRVDLLLFDEQDRVCRAGWDVEAKRSRSERNVTIRLEPASVRALGSRLRAARDAAEERPLRLTVLAHAAPVFTRSTRLRAWDRELLLGTLGPLLEQLPAQSVRLVVFNLDQQKTLMEKPDFDAGKLGEVAQALNRVELGTVDVTVLQNRGGHVNMLADIINRELIKPEALDAVILLGPPSRYFDKLPQSALEERGEQARRLFYIQYRPFLRRGAEFPDFLQQATKAVKGRTFVVHDPAEFATALNKIKGELLPPRSADARR